MTIDNLGIAPKPWFSNDIAGIFDADGHHVATIAIRNLNVVFDCMVAERIVSAVNGATLTPTAAEQAREALVAANVAESIARADWLDRNGDVKPLLDAKRVRIAAANAYLALLAAGPQVVA